MKGTEFIVAFDEAESKYSVIPKVCNSQHYIFFMMAIAQCENHRVLKLAIARLSVTQNKENITNVLKILANNFI